MIGELKKSSVGLKEKRVEFCTFTRKFYLYFKMSCISIIGVEGVEKKIKKWMQEYLGMNPDNISLFAMKTLLTDEKIFSGGESEFNHQDKTKLRDFFKQKGEQLLKSEGKKQEKIESCKLGYANAEAMVMFPYNIPTMTITALWCKGEIDGEVWIPLAERRRRSKNGKYIGED